MNEQLLQELLRLLRRDEDTRARLLEAGALFGTYDEALQQVHRDNAARLDELLQRYGWPGLSLVGQDGCVAAWRIAQHAICTPDLQRGFLVYLQAAVDAGEAPGRQAACLEDRIRFNEDRPQRYGTVLDWNAAGELDCEVEDPAGLDARRAAVGLRPFREALEQQRREICREGGVPPEDYADYRRRARAWAKAAGW
jgi:hypothetical protein